MTILSAVHSKDWKKVKPFSVIILIYSISILFIWNYHRHVVAPCIYVIILVSLRNKLFKIKDIVRAKIFLNLKWKKYKLMLYFLFKRKYIFPSSVHWKVQKTIIISVTISSCKHFGAWIPFPTKRNQSPLKNWLTLGLGQEVKEFVSVLGSYLKDSVAKVKRFLLSKDGTNLSSRRNINSNELIYLKHVKHLWIHNNIIFKNKKEKTSLIFFAGCQRTKCPISSENW